MESGLRTNDILAILGKKKQMQTHELCRILHCSISTLRRDLLKLEDQGLVRRTYGGVILNTTPNTEFSHLYRESSHIKEKQRIADLAMDFVGPGMCLFLDSSSTVFQLCTYLKEIPNLVVITNGLKTALELSEGNNETLKVYITGGEIKPNSSSVISNSSDAFLDCLQFNLAVLSCRGIDKSGVYEASVSQAKAKQTMMQKAKQTILMADGSKFGSSHFFKIGNLEDYEAIITDKEPEEVYKQTFAEQHAELIW